MISRVLDHLEEWLIAFCFLRLGGLLQDEGMGMRFFQSSNLRHLLGDVRFETIRRGRLNSWLHPFSSSTSWLSLLVPFPTFEKG